jgi:hypothetical protein
MDASVLTNEIEDWHDMALDMFVTMAATLPNVS